MLVQEQCDSSRHSLYVLYGTQLQKLRTWHELLAPIEEMCGAREAFFLPLLYVFIACHISSRGGAPPYVQPPEKRRIAHDDWRTAASQRWLHLTVSIWRSRWRAEGENARSVFIPPHLLHDGTKHDLHFDHNELLVSLTINMISLSLALKLGICACLTVARSSLRSFCCSGFLRHTVKDSEARP